MKGVTSYSGLSRTYFLRLLRSLIELGRLERPGLTILDFGCGNGELKRMVKGKVIGYDVVPALSDVKDWKSVDFDVLVANEVFYSFTEAELVKLLKALKKKNKDLELVVGISRLGFLNKVGMFLLGRPGAHSEARLEARKEWEILERSCAVLRHQNVWNLADVYVLVFRKP